MTMYLTCFMYHPLPFQIIHLSFAKSPKFVELFLIYTKNQDIFPSPLFEETVPQMFMRLHNKTAPNILISLLIGNVVVSHCLACGMELCNNPPTLSGPCHHLWQIFYLGGNIKKGFRSIVRK